MTRRVRYFSRPLLSAADLETEQSYFCTRIEEGWALAYEGKEPAGTPPGPVRVALARLLHSRRVPAPRSPSS